MRRDLFIVFVRYAIGFLRENYGIQIARPKYRVS